MSQIPLNFPTLKPSYFHNSVRMYPPNQGSHASILDCSPSNWIQNAIKRNESESSNSKEVPMTPVLASKGLPQPFTPAVGFHNNPSTPNYFFGLKPARSPFFPTQTSNVNSANNFMCPSPKVHLSNLPF